MGLGAWSLGLKAYSKIASTMFLAPCPMLHAAALLLLALCPMRHAPCLLLWQFDNKFGATGYIVLNVYHAIMIGNNGIYDGKA